MSFVIFPLVVVLSAVCRGSDANFNTNANVSLVQFGRLILKSVIFCHSKRKDISLTECAKESALITLDALCKSGSPIELVADTVSLVKTSPQQYDDDLSSSDSGNRSAKQLLSVIEETSSDNRSLVIDNLLGQVLSKFVDSRSINIRFPISALNVLSQSDEEDTGRGKKDKGGGMLAMGAMMAGTAMAMKIAALAALSGKALMTSLMAFMLAALAALKKHSGGDHGSTTYEVINVPGGSHGHHHARADSATKGHVTNSYYSLPELELNARKR